MQLGEFLLQGWVRKRALSKKDIELYQVRYMRLDRVSGELTIWKSIGDSLTENYRGDTILRVDPIVDSSSDQSGPTDYKFPFSLLTDRNFILYTSTEREMNTWLQELKRF